MGVVDFRVQRHVVGVAGEERHGREGQPGGMHSRYLTSCHGVGNWSSDPFNLGG